ncbi:MAG: hypothetical protein ACD_7C00035G0002, partial [uncultured bacterium]
IYLVMHLFWHSQYFFGKFYPKQTKEKGKIICSIILTFISTFVTAYVIALFEVLLGVSSFWDGVFLGFMIWIGFVATHSVFSALAVKRNRNLYLIDNILYFLGLVVVAGVLAG